jgi:hypothetical protein
MRIFDCVILSWWGEMGLLEKRFQAFKDNPDGGAGGTMSGWSRGKSGGKPRRSGRAASGNTCCTDSTGSLTT